MSPLSFIDPAWAQLAELVTELASEGSKKAVQNMNLHISLYLVRCQLVRSVAGVVFAVVRPAVCTGSFDCRQGRPAGRAGSGAAGLVPAARLPTQYSSDNPSPSTVRAE